MKLTVDRKVIVNLSLDHGEAGDLLNHLIYAWRRETSEFITDLRTRLIHILEED